MTHLCKRYWDTCLPFSRKHTLMDSVSCPLPPYSQQLSITLSQWQKDKQLQGSFAKVRRHYPHHFCITKSPYLTGAAIMLLRVLAIYVASFSFAFCFFFLRAPILMPYLSSSPFRLPGRGGDSIEWISTSDPALPIQLRGPIKRGRLPGPLQLPDLGKVKH